VLTGLLMLNAELPYDLFFTLLFRYRDHQSWQKFGYEDLKFCLKQVGTKINLRTCIIRLFVTLTFGLFRASLYSLKSNSGSG